MTGLFSYHPDIPRENTMITLLRTLPFLTLLLLCAAPTWAGGVDPRELSSAPQVQRERPSAAPEETATAVRRAREAVTPAAVAPAPSPVPTEVMSTPAPRRTAASPVNGSAWQLVGSAGRCEALDGVRKKVANIGSFATPQEFARQLQQRGHQAFVLDIGSPRDQEIRVRVPDLKADFEFKRAGLCR